MDIHELMRSHFRTMKYCKSLSEGCFDDPGGYLPATAEAALTSVIEDGYPSHYIAPVGTPALRELIAKRIMRQSGVTVDPKRNLLVTGGVCAGIFAVLKVFLEPGDEALVFDPDYPSYAGTVGICGGKAVLIPLEFNDTWEPNFEALEKAVTARTKLVILSQPNFPTGTVFSNRTIEKLCDFVVAHDLVMLCDMALCELVYDGSACAMPAGYPGMWERTVTFFSLSKGAGLAGFHMAAVLADDHIMDVLYGSVVNLLGGTNTFAQLSAEKVLSDESVCGDNKRRLAENRREVARLLSDIPSLQFSKPDAGMAFWVDASKLRKEPVQMAMQQAGISGEDVYGSIYSGILRITFSGDPDTNTALAACKTAKRILTEGI